MAQDPHSMDGIEAVQHHNNYPEVVPSPGVGAKEAYAYGPSPPQQAQPPPPAPEPQAKRICGLRRTTFLLLALLLLVVIAAAVGGGVGGSMAVKDAYDRGRREEALEAGAGDEENTEGSRIETPPKEGLMELACPGLDGETQKVTLGETLYEFKANCDVDRPSGSGGKDIMRLPAYSYRDCITACAAFNDMDGAGKTECVAAHFNANLLTGDGGNCWLKSELGEKKVNPDAEGKNIMVTGDKV